MRRRFGPLLIALSLALGLAVPLLYGGSAAFTELARLPVWAYLPLAAMVVLAWMCNAARLYLLGRGLHHPLEWRTACNIVVAADFAGAVTPAGSGWVGATIYLLRRQGLPVSRGMAIVAVDHFLDLAWFALAMPTAALLWAVDGATMSQPLRMGVGVAIVTLIGLLALVILLRHHRRVLALFVRLAQRISPGRRRYRVARAIVQFRHAVKLLLGMERRRLMLLYLCCAGHWLLRYGVLPVLLWCLDIHIPWAYLFMVQGVVLFAGQAAMLPGGGGAVELGLGLFLSPYLTPAVTAAVLLAWRGFTYYGALLVGAPLFVWAMGSLRPDAGRLALREFERR